ncbi:MAG: hypothetical protein F6J93_00705 [Oscillatoria sp. SIO1A7]|nr:hypothetical protein [Oscillatoria sp. SIO1A7]
MPYLYETFFPPLIPCFRTRQCPVFWFQDMGVTPVSLRGIFLSDRSDRNRVSSPNFRLIANIFIETRFLGLISSPNFRLIANIFIETRFLGLARRNKIYFNDPIFGLFMAPLNMGDPLGDR